MPGQQQRHLSTWAVRVVKACVVGVAAYVLVAYLVLPAFWQHYERQHGLQGRPMTTVTAQARLRHF
jgi:hypothetical protein